MLCIVSILYSSTLVMSVTFMFMNHPLSMGLILLIQTTLIAMITGLMSHNFWFSYILFMIMIGGMLVLFIYMTSVASNEKFMFSNKISILLFVTITTTTLIMLISDQFILYQNSVNMDLMNSSTNVTYYLSMSKYLNFPLNSWMISLIIYLLLALIAVVKITNITYGPLRQKI
uniref:NADH-ubiquinone oxidoreductase chain 6 n=1 Tax=Cryptalaus larvatus TaxID=341303 RepID=A0A6G9ULM5_9COLE|nr:NADH dehydrogenase subunit 6 [Cryptalaus larvatus]QIR63637.1 NADH dehydrogenase subunit 6 [Cryptalaus larvatus]